MKLNFSVLALCVVPATAFTMVHSPNKKMSPLLLHAYGQEESAATSEDVSSSSDPESSSMDDTSMPMTYGVAEESSPEFDLPLPLKERTISNAPVPLQRRSLMEQHQISNLSTFSRNRNGSFASSFAIPAVPRSNDVNLSDKALELEESAMLRVQGNSLKTWAFQTDVIDRVHIVLKTEGRPLTANVDLWQGPDNIPQRMKIYIEDGATRPFNAVVETPGGQNSVAVRNTNSMEFPFLAAIEAEIDGSINIGLKDDIESLRVNALGRTVQGGAVFTKPFSHQVQSIQVMLQTDGRPLSARLELLQGPNNIKQVLDVYCEDGYTRPFYIILETPDPGCVIRIVNTAPLEFPLTARVEPYTVDDSPNPSGVTSFFIVD